MSSGLSRGRSSSGQTQPQVTLLKMLCLNDYIHSRTIGSELGSDIWLDMSGPDALSPSEQFVSTWTEAQTVWKNLKKPGLTLVCPGYGIRSKTAVVAELLSTFHKDVFPFIQIRLRFVFKKRFQPSYSSCDRKGNCFPTFSFNNIYFSRKMFPNVQMLVFRHWFFFFRRAGKSARKQWTSVRLLTSLTQNSTLTQMFGAFSQSR